MGRLIYRDRASFDIDDRILAHLRIVIMNKLRRNEGFMLQLPVNEGVRQSSIWVLDLYLGSDCEASPVY